MADIKLKWDDIPDEEPAAQQPEQDGVGVKDYLFGSPYKNTVGSKNWFTQTLPQSAVSLVPKMAAAPYNLIKR